MIEIKRERLGEILQKQGLITGAQLEEALEAQKTQGMPLGKSLVVLGFITEPQLAAAIAHQKSLPLVNLEEYEINARAATAIQEDFARNHIAIPIDFEGEKLIVAMANPLNIHTIDDMGVITKRAIKPVVATESDIMHAIDQYLHRTVKEVVETATAEFKKEHAPDEEAILTEDDSPIIKLVNSVISQAVIKEASDIHLEPQEKDMRIRYRVDGVLHEVMTLPKYLQNGIVSRFKIMGELNIAEHRIPQDGRASIAASGKVVDLRIATLPSVFGENVTIRILDKSKSLYKLTELGFQEGTLLKYEEAYRKPYGMILVTGPTGSGKTTTLYATLNDLNSIEKKILTVEDPVEYQLPGCIQIQTHPQAGLTFASGLRSIVRCDPDIIMIGEIRDMETARTAIESALTGHLVLSTLHTNDAPSAITRLIEMGVEPFLVSSSVDCVLAQRLTRVLCENCKQPYEPGVEDLEAIGLEFEPGEERVLYKAKGCRRCFNSGYRGRIGVYELMIMSDEIARLCNNRRSANEIQDVAIREGMATLRQDGFMKARKGITSLEEVLRVVV